MSLMAMPWDEQDQDQRARTVAAIKRRGARASKHPAWPALLSVAREAGWPVTFASDLFVHDRNALSDVDPTHPFLWSIGETGTQIDWLATTRAYRTEHDAKEHVIYLECYRPRMYHWDGATLRACTRFDAIGVLRGFAWGDPEGW
jgi:hypothetical protein